ncbi:MAG: hypothetical protein RML46_13010 [Anaerolineae bacterium]|nr:hypothetical protein [Anaerolineae bacterium]
MAAPQRCPRCGAAVAAVSSPAEARELFARLLGVPAQRLVVHVVDDGDTTIAVGWDPEELLPTSRVAEILGVTPGWVAHAAAAGYFPGAVRAEPTRRRYKRGRWLIPRRALLRR